MLKDKIIGQKIGRLTVLRRCGEARPERYRVVCSCECGGEWTGYLYSLTAGDTRSCGCLNREEMLARFTKHGASKRGPHLREYRIWENMRSRCRCQTDPAYPDYGGRGITICDRWGDFALFLADMGPCPPGLTIDRINNNGGYEPGNCRWADLLTQGQNKRNNVNLTFRGETHCVSEWARRIGIIKDRVLFNRLYRGWPVARALTQGMR